MYGEKYREYEWDENTAKYGKSEEETKDEKIEAREQTLANGIVLAFIAMVAYKLMTGTF